MRHPSQNALTVTKVEQLLKKIKSRPSMRAHLGHRAAEGAKERRYNAAWQLIQHYDQALALDPGFLEKLNDAISASPISSRNKSILYAELADKLSDKADKITVLRTLIEHCDLSSAQDVGDGTRSDKLPLMAALMEKLAQAPIEPDKKKALYKELTARYGDYLGEGTFNVTYKAGEEYVMKINRLKSADESEAALDKPERLVKIWNETYGPEKMAFNKGGVGFFPYIKGQDASPQETATAIADLFIKTGRVVLDIQMPGNVKTEGGKPYIVDLGQADIQMPGNVKTEGGKPYIVDLGQALDWSQDSQDKTYFVDHGYDIQKAVSILIEHANCSVEREDDSVVVKKEQINRCRIVALTAALAELTLSNNNKEMDKQELLSTLQPDSEWNWSEIKTKAEAFFQRKEFCSHVGDIWPASCEWWEASAKFTKLTAQEVAQLNLMQIGVDSKNSDYVKHMISMKEIGGNEYLRCLQDKNYFLRASNILSSCASFGIEGIEDIASYTYAESLSKHSEQSTFPSKTDFDKKVKIVRKINTRLQVLRNKKYSIAAGADIDSIPSLKEVLDTFSDRSSDYSLDNCLEFLEAPKVSSLTSGISLALRSDIRQQEMKEAIKVLRSFDQNNTAISTYLAAGTSQPKKGNLLKCLALAAALKWGNSTNPTPTDMETRVTDLQSDGKFDWNKIFKYADQYFREKDKAQESRYIKLRDIAISQDADYLNKPIGGLTSDVVHSALSACSSVTSSQRSSAAQICPSNKSGAKQDFGSHSQANDRDSSSAHDRGSSSPIPPG